MSRSAWGGRNRRYGYLFISPVLAFLAAVIVLPLGHAFWTSLHRVRGLNTTFAFSRERP